MTSKVLVKIPVNFGSPVGKCTTADIISASVSARAAVAPASSSNSPESIISIRYDPSLHITQLEQNIKFLKEQHHLMLTSLHQEVETLRQRNRDLQFQLVFSKGSLALVKSTPSSPEDDCKPQTALSPKQVNLSSLQVEILERDIAELRSLLTEAKARNSSLENVIDEQKKQLESFSNKSAAPSDESSISTNSPDPDLAFKLEDAEKVIRRLRRENDEQRRELAMIKANQNKEMSAASAPAHQRPSSQWAQQSYEAQRDYYHEQHREPRDHRREDGLGDQGEQQQEAQREGSRFPPLNNTKFWHNNGGTQRGNSRWNHSWDSGRGSGGSRMLNQSLPSIPGIPKSGSSPNNSSNGIPSSAPFSLLNHGGGGGRRSHRGNYRADRNGGGRGGNGTGQSGGRGHWDQNREHRGRDHDRNRDQQGFNE
ncbi:Coiled-coil domain-containing protein 74B [Frankliniella fusca]|uniref:Coiled-coil domain-containing protein 74B n=1 Tax=Frankliniella fusca TaxID=407009 RepID=A0AAE1H056_9NEOP|nr:Coiled-coil domain-containing protein 74B [Frankliniella fusca]